MRRVRNDHFLLIFSVLISSIIIIKFFSFEDVAFHRVIGNENEDGGNCLAVTAHKINVRKKLRGGRGRGR